MDVRVYEDFLKNIIEEANEKQTKKIQETIQDFKTEIKEIRNILIEEIEKRKEVEEKYKQLQLQHLILENQSRKNNIVVFGLQHKLNENKDQNRKQKLLDFTISKLNQHLDVTIDPLEINDIYTLGKQKTDNPILVKFCSFIKKQHILRNCKKLKGTDIIISEDLSVEERKQKATLHKYLKEAKQNKHIAYIRGNKLYIDRKPYNIEELNQLFQDKNKITNDLEFDSDDDEENLEGRGTEKEDINTNIENKELQKEDTHAKRKPDKKVDTRVIGKKLRSDAKKK